MTVDGGGTQYAYDASGQRIRKTTGGVSVDYVYDLSGHAVAEVSSSGVANRMEVFAGSKHLATYSTAANSTFFVHADWLGTERARSNMGSVNSGTLCETTTSLPYGDGMASNGSCDPSPLRFTGKQRDPETASHLGWQDGLDYFGARYYSNSMARFSTPDPLRASASASDAQSWNRYAYGRGNPLRYTDPTGRRYTICDMNGVCQTDYSDANFDKNLSGTSQKGRIYDNNGNQIGTYVRTSFDDLSVLGNLFYNKMSAQRQPTNAFIVAFVVVAVAGGAVAAPVSAPAFITLGLVGQTGASEAAASGISFLSELLATGETQEAQAWARALAESPGGRSLITEMDQTTANLMAKEQTSPEVFRTLQNIRAVLAPYVSW